jgi:serine/threonine-protein kinase
MSPAQANSLDPEGVVDFKEWAGDSAETIGRKPKASCIHVVETDSRTPTDLPVELRDHPRYKVLEKLGEGGMGAAFKAEHRLMGRTVVLKVVNRDLVKEATAVARFQQEMRFAAQLAHPNIVIAYDAEQVGDCHLLVMEYIEGVNLARLIELRGPLPVQTACDLLRQTALGLQNAHEQGMIHRDVKPHNLMVTPQGQIKILDFGLARFASEQGRAAGAVRGIGGITLAGEALGSPDYLAPEQARNARGVDCRADLYALGCTAFFLLTGEVPFSGDTALEKLYQHWQKEPQRIEQLRPELPAELGRLVRKLMEKNPANRYQTAAEVFDALTPFAVASPAVPVSAVVPSGTRKQLPAEIPTKKVSPAPKARGLCSWIWRAVALGLGLGVLATATLLPFRGAPERGLQQADSAGDKMNGGRFGNAPRTRPRVLYLLAPAECSHREYLLVRQALEKGGVDVVLASSSSESVRAEDRSEETVKPELLLDKARDSDFDALVIGGGTGIHVYASGGQEATDARRLIAAMMQTTKPVAAMGMGPIVLSEAGLLRGKPVTCAPAAREKVARENGKLVSEAVVEIEPAIGHGPIITARDADAAGEFGKAILRTLAKPEALSPPQ